MRLTQSQTERFREDGFLVLPNLFSPQEVAVMRDAATAIFAADHPANFREKSSGVVRSAFGLHHRHEVFARLVRHPRFVIPAMQLLDDDRLYVQQVKINTKVAFEGEVWQWHYDFATHHAEDGVPAPLALNLHVFLDDVVEFNGPLYFIPGSHQAGPAPTRLDTTTTSYPLWVVDRDTVARLAAPRGLYSATGPAGTALIFGDCLVHGSPPNLSPWHRHIFSVILNPISNAYTRSDRAEWQHERDLSPVIPLADDCLLEPVAVAAQ